MKIRFLAALSISTLFACTADDSSVANDASVQTVFTAFEGAAFMQGVDRQTRRVDVITTTIAGLAPPTTASWQTKDARTYTCRELQTDQQCTGRLVNEASFDLAGKYDTFDAGDFYSSSYQNYRATDFLRGALTNDELRLDFETIFKNTSPYEGRVKAKYTRTSPDTLAFDDAFTFSGFAYGRAPDGDGVSFSGQVDPASAVGVQYVFQNWAYSRAGANPIGSSVQIRGPLFNNGASDGSVVTTITAANATETVYTIVAKASGNARSATTTVIGRRGSDGQVTYSAR